MTGEFDVARIVICSPSSRYGSELAELLQHDRDLLVVGRCRSASDALPLVKRKNADLLLIDLERPVKAAVASIGKIMSAEPLPIVVLSDRSSLGPESVAAALEAGALEVQHRLQVPLDDVEGARAAMFRRRIKRLSLARVRKQRRAAVRRPSRRSPHRAAAIAVAASTGGPAALETIASALPSDFPIPIFVVQHMSAGFIEGFAAQLDRATSLPVRMARDRQRASPGIWLADDDAHLVIDAQLRTHRDRGAVAGYHRPAADVLFASLAAAAGPRAVSVVLTGMGADGAEGTAAVRAAGGLTIAQDEGTSAIYGMPRMAAAAGAQLVLPLDEIGPTLARMAPVGASR